MRYAKACLLGLVYALTAGGGAYCGILAMVLNPARYPRLSPFCGIAAAVAMALLILWGWLHARLTRGAPAPARLHLLTVATAVTLFLPALWLTAETVEWLSRAL